MAINTKAYDNLYNNYAKSVDENTAQKVKEAKDAANAQLKQAYVQRAQNQRTLNDNLAAAGIRGGATETANIRLANQYGSAVNSINSGLTNSINDINRTAEQTKLAYKQDIDAKKQQYVEDMEREQRQNARQDKQIAYERAQAAEQKKYERAQAADQKKYERSLTSRQQSLDYFTSFYASYTNIANLQKEYAAEAKKKKPNTLKMQVIRARMGYLTDNKNK